LSDLGQLLRKAREQRGYSLDHIQEMTKIRKRYLEAIEEGDYKVLPGSFYVRAFVKSYAEAVGLNAEEILRLYQKELPQPPSADVPPPEPLVRSRRRRVQQSDRIGRIVVSVLMWAFPILIGVVVYLYASEYIRSSPDEIDTGRKITPETITPSPSSSAVTPEPSPSPTVEAPPSPQVSVAFLRKSRNVSYYEVSPAEGLKLEIRIHGGASWVGVGSDVGKHELYTGTPGDGEVLSFDITGPIYVNVGRADHCTIMIDGVEIEDNNSAGSEKFHFTPVDAIQQEESAQG